MNRELIKSKLLEQAVSNVRGEKLSHLYELCETQKTISTKKLERCLDEISDKMIINAIELRRIFDSL